MYACVRARACVCGIVVDPFHSAWVIFCECVSDFHNFDSMSFHLPTGYRNCTEENNVNTVITKSVM